MTFDDLESIAIAWYGSRSWRKPLVFVLDIDPATLWRWSQMETLPDPYPKLIEAWDMLGGPPIEVPDELLEPRQRGRKAGTGKGPKPRSKVFNNPKILVTSPHSKRTKVFEA